MGMADFWEGHLTQVRLMAVPWELEIKTEGVEEKWQHKNLQDVHGYIFYHANHKKEKLQREHIERSRYTGAAMEDEF